MNCALLCQYIIGMRRSRTRTRRCMFLLYYDKNPPIPRLFWGMLPLLKKRNIFFTRLSGHVNRVRRNSRVVFVWTNLLSRIVYDQPRSCQPNPFRDVRINQNKKRPFDAFTPNGRRVRSAHASSPLSAFSPKRLMETSTEIMLNNSHRIPEYDIV